MWSVTFFCFFFSIHKASLESAFSVSMAGRDYLLIDVRTCLLVVLYAFSALFFFYLVIWIPFREHNGLQADFKIMSHGLQLLTRRKEENLILGSERKMVLVTNRYHDITSLLYNNISIS